MSSMAMFYNSIVLLTNSAIIIALVLVLRRS